MSTSSKAKISIETGQTLTDYAKMTDSGDHTRFSLGTIWSGKSGFEPEVRPNGIVTGRNLLSPDTAVDSVAIAAFTSYCKGAVLTSTADSLTFVRATAGKAKITSVTIDSAGSLAMVVGTVGSSATFNDTRNAAGGPPYIPVSSVELGQIRTTVNSSGIIPAAKLFQVVGTHATRFDFPTWDESNIGQGTLADTSAERLSHIKLSSAYAIEYVGALYRDIYVKYYTPIFSELPKAFDFVPAENAHSVSSQQFYNGTIGSASASLGAGSFTALLTDGISDAVLVEQDEIITVKHWPDRNKSPYILTQGTLGIARTFPVAAQNQAVVTIAAENQSASFLS